MGPYTMSPLVMLPCIYLLVVFVACMFTGLVALFVCMIVLDTLYLCLYLCLQAILYYKGEYPFTKIFVLVKEIKECNIFFFLERQSLLI